VGLQISSLRRIQTSGAAFEFVDCLRTISFTTDPVQSIILEIWWAGNIEKEGKTIAGQLEYEAETTATAKLPDPGTYKLTVVVHFEGAPMTAFTEGPLIQIF
jgi:hypothetical protein